MMPIDSVGQVSVLPRELQNWTIPFLGRDAERQIFEDFLAPTETEVTRRLCVTGDSGTGKSYFVRTALFDNLEQNPHDYFCIYVDLSNDEFQSARLISSLLKLSLLAAEPSLKYPLKIPSELTLEEFKRTSADRKSIGWNVIRGLSQAAASFVGMGDAAKEILGGAGEVSTSANDVLAEYLKWVAGQRAIILTVDNYQFMNHEVRLTLEALVNRVGQSVRYIVVDRTVDGVSEIVPPLQKLSDDDKAVSLGKFSLDETRAVVAGSIEGDEALLERLAADIFSKTDGLPKDIEFCLRHYLISSQGNPEKIDISGLLATIDRLPLIHRQFLIVTALLDGGIDQNLARNVIRRVGSLTDDTDLERSLTDLIAHQYLKRCCHVNRPQLLMRVPANMKHG